MTQSSMPVLAIDITKEMCPMTFVRTRLALDRIKTGEILAVTLRGEEPIRNVPATATEQGHRILREEQLPDGNTLLLIEKG